MKVFNKIIILAVTVAVILISLVYEAEAQGPKISFFSDGSQLPNKHNLSSNNKSTLVKYRAADPVGSDTRPTQVCIFCHTPHSANIEGQAPLWNRRFSSETFQRYSSETLQIRSIAAANYGEPNGSSRLCLSCHDGVSRLGAVYVGSEIAMTGGTVTGVIEGFASFKPDTNKMKIGHHPVSFVYDNSVLTSIKAFGGVKSTYQATSLPTYVKLDRQARMQCTTCHDPHQNQSDDTACYLPSGSGTDLCSNINTRKVTPFWVYGLGGSASNDQQAVCLSCHPMETLPTPWTPNPP